VQKKPILIVRIIARPTGGHLPDLKVKKTMTKLTLKNAVTFVETNFIAPELQSQAAQNAGLAINPFPELHMVALAEADCHQDALRPVDVSKEGYACPISGHKYAKGKMGTKDNALYKKLMDAQGMTALYDQAVAPILNAIKKFDGVTITAEIAAAFYADEKNAKRIGNLKNPKSLANAIIGYSDITAPAKPKTESAGSDSAGSDETGGKDTAPMQSVFMANYAAAVAKLETGDIDALTLKTIVAELNKTMEKELLKIAGINAAAWEAAQNSKIKKTA